MPKKFKGENTKAADARARKAAVREAEEEKRRKDEEDAAWRDDDKHVARKQDRKAQRESKRVEQLEKKLANQKLLEEEEKDLKSSAKGATASTKLTRAQIQETRERERREQEKQASSSGAAVKGVTEQEPLEENPNLLELERQKSGEVQARSIEEAIAVLGGDRKAAQDRHPEKRMKAAFAAFEEREMPRLKAENPTLRMSQLRQLLRKEWMKSPDNPMIQELSHGGRGT